MTLDFGDIIIISGAKTTVSFDMMALAFYCQVKSAVIYAVAVLDIIAGVQTL